MATKKYTVEKSAEPSGVDGEYYFMIWVKSRDVFFYDEEVANQVCDALNLAENMRKVQRKVRDLASALEVFNEV